MTLIAVTANQIDQWTSISFVTRVDAFLAQTKFVNSDHLAGWWFGTVHCGMVTGRAENTEGLVMS